MLGVNSVQFSLRQGRKVKVQHFLSRTPFGTHYVRGKQRTVILTSGEGKSSYSVFFRVLYLARIMLGVNSALFSLHQGRNVKLQHFLSPALFGSHYVRGKQRRVFLTSGEEKSSYSISFLVLYSARIMLGVNSVQLSLHQGMESQVTAFSFAYSIWLALC